MINLDRFAAIDIGSFNCRLVVVEKQNNNLKIIHNFSKETNLIKDIAYNNEFTHEKISNTVNCLKEISNKIKSYNVGHYRCIATEACRQVINPDFFLLEVKEKTGLNVEIISSFEEGRLSFKGCFEYHKKFKEDGLIFDIGGGSTEITFFNSNSNQFYTKSISFGVINLSEKKEIFGIDFINKKINNYFNEIKKNINTTKNYSAIGSCSTITSICAVYLKLKFFNLKKIEGQVLSLSKVLKTCKEIQKLTSKQKLNHPCIGNKYQLLVNGIFILKRLLDEFPVSEILVTNKGLRQGMINDFFNI